MNIKQITKIYPRINNENILDFQIPASKFQVLLSEVCIHFKVQLPRKKNSESWEIIPENWFGAKQFSSVEVKINDENVTHRSMGNEYFLGSYFNTIVNYQKATITSGCETMGIFDFSCMDQTYISQLGDYATWIKDRNGRFNDFDYEIMMPLQNSIFNSDNVLPSNLKWSVCFERAKAELSCLITEANKTIPAKYIDPVLDLTDIYLTVPYLEDRKTMERELNWSKKAIGLSYDHYDIHRFVLPSGSKISRLNNILNGDLPKAIVFGVMKEDAYMGHFEKNATLFTRHAVKKLDIQVDGNSVPGCPYELSKKHMAVPYTRFLDLVGQNFNPNCNGVMTLFDFDGFHFLHCANLLNQTGSLTLELEFEVDVPEGYIVILCGIEEVNLKIDKYGNFQK